MGVCRVQGTRPPRLIDGCAVATAPLAAVVDEWVERWNRDHPDLAAGDRGKQRAGAGTSRNDLGQLAGNEAVGAAVILEERTQMLDRSGRGVPRRTIYNVIHRKWRFTELRTADLLIAAIERPEVFHDGTLEIEPNPKAPPAARAACCGGSSSLNGSFS